jgi:hypothetical protein
MPLKLTFSKVVVQSFTRKPASGTVKISCAPSKAVAKAMGWGEVPDWQKSSAPAGKLDASIVEFVPSKSEVGKFAFEFKGSATVRDFQFIRVQVKKGKTAAKAPTFRTELHCAIDFTDANGGKHLEAYMQSVDESSIRVTYEKEPEQDELPGVETTDEQRQATMEAND